MAYPRFPRSRVHLLSAPFYFLPDRFGATAGVALPFPKLPPIQRFLRDLFAPDDPPGEAKSDDPNDEQHSKPPQGRDRDEESGFNNLDPSEDPLNDDNGGRREMPRRLPREQVEVMRRVVTLGPGNIHDRTTLSIDLPYWEALLFLVQDLSDPLKVTMLHYLFEELAPNEIAGALDITAGNASTRLSRAKREILDEIDRHYPTDDKELDQDEP